VTNVAHRRVSPRDERTAEQLAFGGMSMLIVVSRGLSVSAA
jgi:hypothetical protein